MEGKVYSLRLFFQLLGSSENTMKFRFFFYEPFFFLCIQNENEGFNYLFRANIYELLLLQNNKVAVNDTPTIFVSAMYWLSGVEIDSFSSGNHQLRIHTSLISTAHPPCVAQKAPV
jgi:hypothetical protein